LLNASIFAVQNGAFRPHLATRRATIIDGYVVLILLLVVQTRKA